MSSHSVIILLFLAITPFSSLAIPAKWVRIGSTRWASEKKESHSFLIDNSFKRASPLRVNCSYWGEEIEDRNLDYEGQVRWSSQISSPNEAVHCTCAVSFPPKFSNKFTTTQFDAIASKNIRKGVHRDEHETYVAYLWRWFLKKGGIYYYDYEDLVERFVKNYEVPDKHRPKH